MKSMPDRPGKPVPEETSPPGEQRDEERYVNLERIKRTKEDYESFMKELNRILEELEKEME